MAVQILCLLTFVVGYQLTLQGKISDNKFKSKRIVHQWSNRECSQVRMVDAISQPGCAECGAGGLVLTDYRPYAFLPALLSEMLPSNIGLLLRML